MSTAQRYGHPRQQSLCGVGTTYGMKGGILMPAIPWRFTEVKQVHIRIWKQILDADTWFYEIFIAHVMIIWGMFMMQPSWRSDLNGLYRAFMSVVPNQFFWNALLIGIGIVKILATALNWYRIRRWTCAASILLWVFITLVFLQIPRQSPGTVIIPMYAVGCAFAYRYIDRHRLS